jgi:hypothetical protein
MYIKNNKETRVSVIPNAMIRKYFKMQKVAGVYRIIDVRTNSLIYDNGKCPNCGSVDINIDGETVSLAIRSIAYVLRYDTNDCDYRMFNIVEPLGSTQEERSKNLKYFNVEDVRCYSRGRVEWKFLPKFNEVQWSKRETKSPTAPSNLEQLVMSFSKKPEVSRNDILEFCDKTKTWDVEVNGTLFTFKDKNDMLEMCKALASK